MRELLRVPGYRHWLAGRAASWFGDTVMVLVLSMWVKTLTGSSAQAGITMAFYTAPNLLAPLVGVLVDRVSRRAVLVVGNAISALALVPLALVRGPRDAVIIWGVALVYGVSGVLLPAASVALQRSIVPDHLLLPAQGLQQTIGTSFQVAAPMIGAVLFARWGGVGPASLSFACFAIGMVSFLAFRQAPGAGQTERTPFREKVLAGLRHVWRTIDLRRATVALLVVELVGGLLEGAMYSVTDTFHRPATWASTIALAQSLGMVVGVLVATTVVRRLGESRAMALGLGVAAVGACAAAAATTLWVFLGVVAVVGLFLPMVFVASGTLQQRLTPQDLMGRVTTATAPLFTLVSVGSLAAGSLLVTVWSFREIYPVVGAGCLVAAAHLALARRRPAPMVGTSARELAS